MQDPDSGAGPRDLVIVGAGGFGRESADVVEAINRSMPGTWNLKGIYDDGPTEVNLERLKARDIAYLGGLPDRSSDEGLSYVVGVGRPQTRRTIAQRCDKLGWTAVPLIHPRAEIGSRLSIAPGAIVCAGAVVSTNVTVGAHVHVNPNATIGHDTVLDDYVSINPGAIVSGEVHVLNDCLIGAGATVLQGLRVRQGVVVGASACVTRDVAEGLTVKGIPAK